MKRFLKKFLSLIVSPFGENLSLFVGWLILILPTPIYYCFFFDIPSFGRNIFLWNVFSIYIFLLVIKLSHAQKIKQLFIVIVTIFLVIFSIVDLYCLVYFKCSFSLDEAVLVAQTNFNEAQGMLSMYTDWRIFIYASLLLLVAYLGYFAIKKLRIKNTGYCAIPLLVLLSFLPSGIKHIDAMAQSPLFKPFVIAIRVEKTPSTEDLITNPNVTQPLFLPNNVVLIIGESHSKSHSSFMDMKRRLIKIRFNKQTWKFVYF